MNPLQPIEKHRFITPCYRGGLRSESLQQARFTITADVAQRIEELRELAAEHQLAHIAVAFDGPVAFGDDLEDLDNEGVDYRNLMLCVSPLTFWFQAAAEDEEPGELATEARFTQEVSRLFGIGAVEIKPLMPTEGQATSPNAIPRAVVFMEGGIIQEVLADQPLRLLLVDADTEGGDPDNMREIEGDNVYTDVWQMDSKDGIDAARIAAIFGEFEGGDAPTAQDNESSNDGQVRVRVAVLATNGEGAPDVYTCELAISREQYDDREHYNLAKESASANGYEEPMIAFDQNDQAARSIAVGTLPAWLRGH